MGFKIGDIVYCINNHYTMNKPTSSLIIHLDLDTPYEIKDITKKYTYIIGNSQPFSKERFILKDEYITMIRRDKIEKLKNIIHSI